MSIPKVFSRRDFSCGQYDREYQAAQTEISNRGMSYARNVISSPLREIKSRPGTRFVQGLDSKAVLIPYRNGENDDVVCVQGNKLSIFKIAPDYTLVPAPSSADILSFPQNWSSNTNDGWRVANWSSAPEYYKMLQSAGQVFSIDDITTTERDRFVFFENDSPVVLDRINVRFVGRVGVVGAGGHRAPSDPIIQFSDDGLSWAPIKTIVENIQSSIVVTKYVGDDMSEKTTEYSYDIVNNNYSTPHRYWRILFTGLYSTGNILMPIIQLMTSTMFVSNVRFFSGGTGEYIDNNFSIPEASIQNIKYAQSYNWNGDNQLCLVAGGTTPYYVKYSRNSYSSGTLTLSEQQGGQERSVWDVYGLPSAVAFFQNRLWFGGFESYPNRAISSAFGDYNNWTVPDPILASSPIVTECNQMKGKITDLFAGWDVLYAQCSDGVATIESGNAAIAPNNVNFLLKIQRRSSGVTPTVKDNVLFFVGNTKRDIYVITFDLIAGKYQIGNVSKFSHNYLSPGITELHYVDTQARLVYGSLANGNMFALLYDAESGAVGLYPLETDGEIFDLSVVQAYDENRLLAVISRQGAWTIELFNPVVDFGTTDEFGQDAQEKNQATISNLITQPYIDCAVSTKNQKNETWYLNGNILRKTPNLYNWGGAYTLSATPAVGDQLYKADGTPETQYKTNTVYGVNDSSITVLVAGGESEMDPVITVALPRNSAGDINTDSFMDFSAYGQQIIRFFTAGNQRYDLKIVGSPETNKYNVEVLFGDNSSQVQFLSLLLPMKNVVPQIQLSGTQYQCFDAGRYLGNVSLNARGELEFKEPVYDLTYGLPYRKIGVVQDNTNYLRKKRWGAIALNVMDTLSLKIGAKIDKMQDVILYKGDNFYDASPIMQNGIKVQNIADTPEFEKNLIFMTDEGLPFCIRAIEASGDITDRNTN